MGRVNDDSYIQIQGWMMTRLDLKPLELIVFAMIQNFTVNNQEYTGSYSYLIESLKISKPTAIKVLNNLVKKKYILEKKGNATTPNKYTANTKYIKKLTMLSKETLPQVVKKIDYPSKETLPQVVKKIDYPSKETLPNNTINNTNKKTNINTNNIATATDKEKEEILKTYTDINPRFTSLEIQMLEEDIKVYPTKWIMEAMRRSVAQGKYKLSYIEGILNSWMANGYDEAGGKNGDGKQKGMVRQGQSVRRGRLYKQRKVETIEDVQAKFANETSGWD